MKSIVLPAAALLLAMPAPATAAAAYHCRADDTAPGASGAAYRLVPDRSGGSMGNPAQRGAFELRDAHTGQLLTRCPQGFRGGRLVCPARSPAGAAERFTLDRGSGRYTRVRAGGAPERGRCTPARGRAVGRGR